MGRMHSHGKGKSSSLKPFITDVPTYMTCTIQALKDNIISLAKKNVREPEIGNICRDKYGVGNLPDVLGCTLVQFLKENNCCPQLPADMMFMRDRLEKLKKHLNVFAKDIDAKHRYSLLNARYFKVLKYYVTKNVIPVSIYEAERRKIRNKL